MVIKNKQAYPAKGYKQQQKPGQMPPFLLQHPAGQDKWPDNVYKTCYDLNYNKAIFIRYCVTCKAVKTSYK